MMTFWKKLRRAAGSFRSDRAGNVVITFALATLPIVGTVGFAVDFSRANSIKTAMASVVKRATTCLSRRYGWTSLGRVSSAIHRLAW